MAKKKSRTGLIVLLVIGVLLGGGGTAAYIMKNRTQAVTVVVEPAGKRSITQTVSATGKIQPETQVKVSSETSGEIIFLGVKEGDAVKKGQLLVRIKPDIVETQLDQFKASAEAAKANANAAKAELERATENMNRVTTLFQKKYASQEELEQARSGVKQRQESYNASLQNYEQARASLRQVQVQASRTSIYAPINGIVTSLSVEQGEKVVGTAQMQGTEIMRISDLNVMNALVDVDENDVVLLGLNDTARIEIDAFPNRHFNAIVYQVGNSAKTNSIGTQEEVVNFQVRLRLIDLDPKLRPGMSCNADIETETRTNVIAIPLQAVTIRKVKEEKEEEEETMLTDTDTKKKTKKKLPSVVFVSDNGKARMVEVTTGISDNGYIEITSGLQENTTIVTGSFQAITKELEEGTAISVESTDKKKKSLKQ